MSKSKYDLKHLILEKTSVAREKNPMIIFERLKMANSDENNKKKKNQDQEEKKARA